MGEIEEIKDFVKARNEMLEKRSVEELKAFMELGVKKGWYGRYEVKLFMSAKPIVQQATLCKMICNVLHISKETKEWALAWLEENGFKADIY